MDDLVETYDDVLHVFRQREDQVPTPGEEPRCTVDELLHTVLHQVRPRRRTRMVPQTFFLSVPILSRRLPPDLFIPDRNPL